MIPHLDPLDDRYRWCVHCSADCWPEPGHQRHTGSCPTVTGVYPVDTDDVAMGVSCCLCSAPFAAGEVYMLRDADSDRLAAAPDLAFVVCVGCAAQDRSAA